MIISTVIDSTDNFITQCSQVGVFMDNETKNDRCLANVLLFQLSQRKILEAASHTNNIVIIFQ